MKFKKKKQEEVVVINPTKTKKPKEHKPINKKVVGITAGSKAKSGN